MRRRAFIRLIGSAMLLPHAARAQQPANPVIGYLGFGSPGGFATRLTAFRQGLEETGYREGENVTIEYRWADGSNDKLPTLAEDLVRRQVAVIATPGSANAARAAKVATTKIPIVFETGADPVASELVTSLNRPEGNITGISSLNVEVGRKRLEIVRELLPASKIAAALINPANINAKPVAADLQAAARALGLDLHILYASSEQDFAAVFSKLAEIRADALVVNPEPLFTGRSKELVDLTLSRRIPALFFSRDFVAEGGLMSYGGSVAESHRQAGIYIGRILKGATPGDLPVQQVTKFDLAINLKTAKLLGLTVSQTLLATADDVVE
jgi:putative ABC transport system substrate-binding protein